jgi:hypothetical protein
VTYTVLTRRVPAADLDALATHYAEWPLTVYQNDTDTVLWLRFDSPDRPAGFDEWEHYHHYRSTPALSDQEPVFFALNTFDSTDDQSTRDWIDAAQVLESDSGVPAGIVCGSAYVKADGTGLLNFSGWTSADAHADFVASGVLRRAFAQLAPPGPPGPVNGGFRRRAN